MVHGKNFSIVIVKSHRFFYDASRGWGDTDTISGILLRKFVGRFFIAEQCLCDTLSRARICLQSGNGLLLSKIARVVFARTRKSLDARLGDAAVIESSILKFKLSFSEECIVRMHNFFT